MKQTRRSQERHGIHEARHGQETAFAQEGSELVQRTDERDQIDGSKTALEHEARKPEPAEIALHTCSPVHRVCQDPSPRSGQACACPQPRGSGRLTLTRART